MTKKEKLLKNKDVRRWYNSVCRSSINTAEVRLRKMGKFCENHRMTPMKLVKLGTKNPKAVADLLEDYITTMESKGYAPQYIKAVLTAVKSWLAHFDIQVSRKMRIQNVDGTPTLVKERVPTGEEMAELYDRADPRTAVMISLIAKAGLRPQVLGNKQATDGLMIKDLPDLVISSGTAKFTQMPARIIVRSTLSKAGHSDFTYITRVGARKIVAYLNTRIDSGESLGPESALVAPLHTYWAFRGKNQGKKFLSTVTVGVSVRRVMRPRFKWRPYVLRSFFDTQLLIAESRGRIAHDFRVFFMGHVGSIEAKYTTNKSILSDALVSEMREAFERSEEFLDLEMAREDPMIKRKKEMQTAIEKATPEQLGRLYEMLEVLNVYKIDHVRK